VSISQIGGERQFKSAPAYAMNTKDLVRADTWWRLRQKIREELLGEKPESGYGFNTDA